MRVECFEDQMFISSDLTTQGWQQVQWMKARLMLMYEMTCTMEWPMEFVCLEPLDIQPAATLRAWYDYQLEYYEREMRKATPHVKTTNI